MRIRPSGNIGNNHADFGAQEFRSTPKVGLFCARSHNSFQPMVHRGMDPNWPMAFWRKSRRIDCRGRGRINHVLRNVFMASQNRFPSLAHWQNQILAESTYLARIALPAAGNASRWISFQHVQLSTRWDALLAHLDCRIQWCSRTIHSECHPQNDA